MEVRAVSGPVPIAATGQATTFGGAGLDLTFEALDGRLTLGLTFRSDPSVPDVTLRAAADPSGLRLELVNFDGSDGRGSLHPVLVGALGADLVLAHFRVFRHGRSPDRTVFWTFYRVPSDRVTFEDGPGSAPRVR